MRWTVDGTHKQPRPGISHRSAVGAAAPGTGTLQNRTQLIGIHDRRPGAAEDASGTRAACLPLANHNTPPGRAQSRAFIVEWLNPPHSGEPALPSVVRGSPAAVPRTSPCSPGPATRRDAGQIFGQRGASDTPRHARVHPAWGPSWRPEATERGWSSVSNIQRGMPRPCRSLRAHANPCQTRKQSFHSTGSS